MELMEPYRKLALALVRCCKLFRRFLMQGIRMYRRVIATNGLAQSGIVHKELSRFDGDETRVQRQKVQE